MAHLLYRICKYTFITLTPFWILLASLAFHLPQADVHKEHFRDRNVYENLYTEISAIDSVGSFSFKKLLQLSIWQDVLTPQKTQEITEINIDNSTKWLRGETDIWEWYFPSKEVVGNLENKLDSTVLGLKNTIDIPTCGESVAQKIKIQGFSDSTDCLPSSVLSGETKIDDFVESSDQADFINRIQNQPSLKSTTLTTAVQDSQALSDTAYSWILTARNTFIQVQKNAILGWGLVFVLLLSSILLSILAHKKALVHVFSTRMELSHFVWNSRFCIGDCHYSG
jgi:hypothetical protein